MEKLYISDLDGTLLDGDSRLSDKSTEILRDLLDQGIDFVIATARGYASTHDRIKHLPYHGELILYNGACIMSAEGELLWLNAMSSDLLDALGHTLRGYEKSLVFSLMRENNVLMVSEELSPDIQRFIDLRKRISNQTIQRFSDVKPLAYEKVMTVTLIADEKTACEAQDCLKGHEIIKALNVHLMPYPELEGLFTLTMQPSTSDKGVGIDQLLRMRKKQPDQILVFGDQLNDLPMFKKAHVRLAVANAHDQLKAVSDQVIGPNSSSSVALYMKEDYLK